MIRLRWRLCAVFLLLFIFSAVPAMAAVEKPFEITAEMEKITPEFGSRPWEEALKQDMSNHKEDVELSCHQTAKQIEKERKEKERKILEEKKREEERKRLLEEQANTQDEYTNTENEKIITDTEGREWKSLGSKRVTHYCPGCNSPANSYASSSGKRLFEGAVACSWLPIGSIVKINGKVYKNLDRCGTDAIDIFRDTPSGCSCNSAGSYYAEIFTLK